MIAWDADRTRDTYDMVANTDADHLITQVAEPQRTLDVGCGASRLMPYLTTRGCVVEGLNRPSEIVRRAQHDHPEFHVRVSSLAQLPYPDATFDGVMNWYATIHSPDEQIPKMLREMGHVLCLGGVVLLEFQVGQEPREMPDGYSRRGHDITLVRYSRTVRWMTERL